MGHDEITEAPETQHQRNYREQRERQRHMSLERKRESDCKFDNIASMRSQLTALKTLNNAGYDVNAIQRLTDEWRNSVKYAQREIDDMLERSYALGN